jgi:hypothetical protein
MTPNRRPEAGLARPRRRAQALTGGLAPGVRYPARATAEAEAGGNTEGNTPGNAGHSPRRRPLPCPAARPVRHPDARRQTGRFARHAEIRGRRRPGRAQSRMEKAAQRGATAGRRQLQAKAAQRTIALIKLHMPRPEGLRVLAAAAAGAPLSLMADGQQSTVGSWPIDDSGRQRAERPEFQRGSLLKMRVSSY